MAKTANPKAVKSKPAGRKTAVTETLTKELKSLLPKLDEEGLAFLVKQAHVHLYNMQVDALNQTIIKDAQRQKTKAIKTGKSGKSDGKLFLDIKISESGSGYHILCDNQWISFTSGEITNMVKMVYAEGTELEIRGRLHNWLTQERADLLNTAGIANKFDDKLKELIALLKKNFKLKK